jgi:hypothetical protein
MRAATADRLLCSQRKGGQRGLSTTRAGTLLKQQIPIRTFEAWNETHPGLSSSRTGAPIVAKTERVVSCTRLSRDLRGHRLDRMLTPLASEPGAGPCSHLAECARSSPFRSSGLIPITAGRRINESVIAYCEREKISFTRGRPYLKNDQCFVEQMNGVIVRKARGL